MILDKHLLNEQRNEGRNLHVLPVGSRTSYSPRCVLTYEETITRASNIFLPCWGGFDWLDNGRKCKHRKSTKIQTVKNCLCLRRKRWLETVRPHRAIKVQSENECTRVHTSTHTRLQRLKTRTGEHSEFQGPWGFDSKEPNSKCICAFIG